MLLQVRRLSLLFAGRAPWHVNCRKKTEMQKCISYLAWADSKPASIPLTVPACPWSSFWEAELCYPAPQLLILIRRVGGVHTKCIITGFTFLSRSVSRPSLRLVAPLRSDYLGMPWRFYFTVQIFYFTGIAVLLPRSYGFLIFNFYDVLMDIFVTWPPGEPLLFIKLCQSASHPVGPSASIKFKAPWGEKQEHRSGGGQRTYNGIMQSLTVIEAI